MPITTKTLADLKIGIFGGGQLSRMLALRGFELGTEVHVFSENETDPAAQVSRFWQKGKFSSQEDLSVFLKSVNVATFESEFMDAALLSDLSKKFEVRIYPQPELMGLIQDRLTQKEILLKHKLPTAEFMAVQSMGDLKKAFEQLGPLVLKKRRFGYDGYGTFFIRDQKAFESLPPKLFEEDKTGFIAEKFIKFKRELACVIVRSSEGSIAELPFVETWQENSKCLWVKGPIKPSQRLTSMAANLRKFLKTIDYVGAMGFELFETEYDLLVNELAPRVHNSAHYSMNALTEDQFSLHMKAVAGIRISSPRALSAGFAMYNLLGSTNEPPVWSEIPDGIGFHWYGKKENRPGRKMGHMNALGTTPESALNTLKIARRKFDV